jgi:hypothetical protein
MNNINQLTVLHLRKLVGVVLLILPFYQLFVSLQDIFVVLPKLNLIDNLSVIQSIRLDLLKKAIVISTGLLFDSAYGLHLLLKPNSGNHWLSVFLGIGLLFVSRFLFQWSAIDQLILQFNFLPLT